MLFTLSSIDPLRDIETINLELIFSDIEVLERRKQRVARGAKNDKDLAKELKFIERLLEFLEGDNLAINLPIENEDEVEYLKNLIY